MGQSIQEWTKQNLWKKAFKKFEVIWSTDKTASQSNEKYVCVKAPTSELVFES